MRNSIFEFVKIKYDVVPEYLWNKYPNFAILRCPSNKKWFALIGDVNQQKLGLQGHNVVDVLNVKCHPIMIGSLRMEKGYLPAYHMNKEHWISILLDGTVHIEQIFNLLNLSYDIVKNS